jgi:hypothetical protein
VKKPVPVATKGDDWRDLRDERGKLCARIDTKRMVLEIQRSDRKQIARFDLRVYVVELRIIESKPDIE